MDGETRGLARLGDRSSIITRMAMECFNFLCFHRIVSEITYPSHGLLANYCFGGTIVDNGMAAHRPSVDDKPSCGCLRYRQVAYRSVMSIKRRFSWVFTC